MKKFLVLLVTCLAFTTAHADVIASMGNENGGRIDLSTALVPAAMVKMFDNCKGDSIAKAWGKGADIYGCWKVVGDTIVIDWLTGPNVYESHTYAYSAFTINQATMAQLRKQADAEAKAAGKAPGM
jgi:hypothetical protein